LHVFDDIELLVYNYENKNQHMFKTNTLPKFSSLLSTKMIVIILGFLLIAGVIATTIKNFDTNSIKTSTSQKYDFYVKYDTDYILSVNHFQNYITTNTKLTKVRIDSLPQHSTLKLNGTQVVEGQVIEVAELPNLIIHPIVDEYDTLSWSGFDGNTYLPKVIMNIGVGFSFGSPPTMGNVPKTVPTNTDIVYSQADFLAHFSDVDSHNLVSIQILSLPTNGTLYLNNVPVSISATISFANLSNLKYTPNNGFKGFNSILFTALDSGFLSSLQAVMELNIEDSPPVITPVPKSGPQNTTITFTAADFTSHYADPNSDPLFTITINNLPTNGVLKFNGVPVVAPLTISASTLGQITFEPTTGFAGNTSFNWTATDGCPQADVAPSIFDMIFGAIQASAESCQDSNISQVNITITAVTPTNQPPTMTGQTIVIKKTQSGAFAGFAATDPNGNTPITFATSAINPQLGCTQSNAGQAGNIITCNPNISLAAGQYSFQVTPTDSLSLAGQPVTFTVDLQNPINVAIDLNKSKPNDQIRLNDTVTVQGDIYNPNPFALTNVTTDFTIDTTKVSLVANSGQEGQISGTKYAALEMLKKIFILDAQAASGAVITYPTSSSMRVFLPSIPANTTYSYVFNVQAQNAGVGLVTGASTVQGLSLPSVNDQTSVGTVATATSSSSAALPRTGGYENSLGYIVSLFGIFASLIYISNRNTSRRVPVKIVK
jgi:hypothetical protein